MDDIILRGRFCQAMRAEPNLFELCHCEKTTNETELINHTTDMYDLLLLADPSKDQINEYLRKSKVYGVYLNDILIDVYVLCPVDTKMIEVKKIIKKIG